MPPIIPQSDNQKRIKRRRSGNAFPKFLAVVAIVSWASVLIAWTRSSLNHQSPAKVIQQKEQKQQDQIRKVVDQALPAKEIDLFPDDLQHEPFFNTLKSCLPNGAEKKCKQFVPDNHIQRIAILSPPGALGFVFESFIDEVVRLHSTEEQQATFELIKTSHVPPYGYGKTHGYTKIIRLASLPLRLAASDLVLEESTTALGHHSMDDITIRDLDQALRQVVRWHCRLSHVAAHTATMTISLENLLEDPWEEEYQVRTFLNLKEEDHSLEDHLKQEHHIDEDELAGSMDEIVRRSTLLLLRLTRMNPNTKLEQVLDQAVNDELATTKNLDAWPCKSFWTFPEEITEISKRTAQLFSPNCTASKYTSCFVPRDFCEEKGDAKCKKQK